MLAELYALEHIKTASGCISVGQTFRAGEQDTIRYLKQGVAILSSAVKARRWIGLQWPDSQVAILASGPSMSAELALRVKTWRDVDPVHRKVIVINTTFRLALWADVLYACDYPWWKQYITEVRASFKGELWTQDDTAQRAYSIRYIQSRRGRGLNADPGVINQGENSGYQAIGLAYQAGGKKILLFGFDMHGGHWHKPHPEHLNKAGTFNTWLTYFPELARDLTTEKIEVINYTPGSAIKNFIMADPKELV